MGAYLAVNRKVPGSNPGPGEVEEEKEEEELWNGGAEGGEGGIFGVGGGGGTFGGGDESLKLKFQILHHMKKLFQGIFSNFAFLSTFKNFKST